LILPTKLLRFNFIYLGFAAVHELNFEAAETDYGDFKASLCRRTVRHSLSLESKTTIRDWFLCSFVLKKRNLPPDFVDRQFNTYLTPPPLFSFFEKIFRYFLSCH